MIDFYNPRQANDIRFQAIFNRFSDVEIQFVSGFTGWSWQAKWKDQLRGEDCFLSPDLAVDNCLEVMMADEVKWQKDPFAKKPVTSSDALTQYLSNWDKKYKK